eukprot:COSAG04_NODE_2930_length_3375_cov_2.137057_3_plen_213_part_00
MVKQKAAGQDCLVRRFCPFHYVPAACIASESCEPVGDLRERGPRHGLGIGLPVCGSGEAEGGAPHAADVEAQGDPRVLRGHVRRLDPVQQPAREDQDPVGRRLDAKRAAEREVDVVVELCARQPPQQPAKAEQRARTACERQRRASRSQPVGRARGKPRDIDRNRRCRLAWAHRGQPQHRARAVSRAQSNSSSTAPTETFSSSDKPLAPSSR